MNKNLYYFFKIILLFIFFNYFAFSQDKPSKAYIQDIEIDYSSTNIVYAATLGQGLFKSTNYGEKWVLIVDTTKYREFNVIKLFPNNPNKLITGGEKTGLLLSEDKGNTWKEIGLQNKTICDISIDEKNPERIFVLTEEGIYFNNNIKEDKWQLSFDYKSYIDTAYKNKDKFPYWYYTRFQRIAINPYNPNMILASARWEGGYYQSNDGGKKWIHKTISGIFRRVDGIFFHPKDPNIIYLGTHHQGLFASYNGGVSFVPHSDGLKPQIRTPYYGAYLISGFTIDPSNPKIFYTGSDYSNWKTTNGGLSWFELDKSLTCEFVRTMSVDPKNSNIVYAGSNVGVYKSTDKGKTWKAINNGFREFNFDKIIEVKLKGKMYLYGLSKDYPFVYRKSNNDSWKSFSWLLSEYQIKEGKDIYYDKKNKILVLVTDKGDYISKDEGYRWCGEGSKIEFKPLKSDKNEIKNNVSDSNSFVLNILLDGKVFFDDAFVESYYKKPPYISLQLVEEGYPYNNTIPLWCVNIKNSLKFDVNIPKNLVKLDKKYILYAEVRDFQKNYKTGFIKVKFSSNKDTYNFTIMLNEGFCLKH
ncbi:MAG TPA: hypothetical protein VIR55_06460 [Ignavibacteria bacterium]